VGVASCYLRREFFLERVYLAGEADRDTYVQLITCGGELAGMWSYEREPDALTVYGRLLVV
jgi:hypothetical protein